MRVDDENMNGTSAETNASQTCQKCNYVGNKSNFSKHSCEKRIFFANDGGYCPNNCGFFTKIWSVMEKHLRTTCQFGEEGPSKRMKKNKDWIKCGGCNFKTLHSEIFYNYQLHNCPLVLKELRQILTKSKSKSLNCDDVIEEMSPVTSSNSKQENKITEKLKKWLHEKVLLKENSVILSSSDNAITTKNFAADVKDSIGKNFKVVKIVKTSVENFEKSIKIVHPSATNLKSSSEIFLEESQQGVVEDNFKESSLVKGINNFSRPPYNLTDLI